MPYKNVSDDKKWHSINAKKHPERYSESSLRWRKNTRTKILEKYGNKCSRCGFSDIRALQIDHVNGGGNKELNSLKIGGSRGSYYKVVLGDTTGKYQILCANCNWIKRYENKEYNLTGRK